MAADGVVEEGGENLPVKIIAGPFIYRQRRRGAVAEVVVVSLL